ncbi:hypothetical protein [Streptomyces sp. NPDC058045]|uniref:hypothetical protein n=1 Tax=Streptomyces sp. NPDC058045 TaxID=3346311 RepID=UPI0036E592D3
MFNQPDTSFGGFFKPAEHNGHLVLITKVRDISKRFDTLRNEEIDQAEVDIVDLDGDGQLAEGVAVTHKAIVSRFSVGQTMILGRIGQVATKSGFQAWALLPFAEGTDDIKAQAWVTANQPTFSQAAPAPAAAVPPGVNPTTGEITTPPPATVPPAGLTPQQYAAAQQTPATAALAQQAAQIPQQQGQEPPF